MNGQDGVTVRTVDGNLRNNIKKENLLRRFDLLDPNVRLGRIP